MTENDAGAGPWGVAGPTLHVGGEQVVRRRQAPLGRLLPYRRAAGQQPAGTGGADQVSRRGWRLDLGDRGLGDLLLGLAAATALAAVAPGWALHYSGVRASLLHRSTLPVTAEQTSGGPHQIATGGADPVAFAAVPEQPPTWLDLVDDDHVQVHAALPMRYYLSLEQTLGIRLPDHVWLRHDERGWSVEHAGPGDRYEVTPCVDEDQARAELARVMRPGQEWRRMDQLSPS